MSRILQALRQIEGQLPSVPPPEPVSAEELAGLGLAWSLEPWRTPAAAPAAAPAREQPLADADSELETPPVAAGPCEPVPETSAEYAPAASLVSTSVVVEPPLDSIGELNDQVTVIDWQWLDAVWSEATGELAELLEEAPVTSVAEPAPEPAEPDVEAEEEEAEAVCAAVPQPEECEFAPDVVEADAEAGDDVDDESYAAETLVAETDDAAADELCALEWLSDVADAEQGVEAADAEMPPELTASEEPCGAPYVEECDLDEPCPAAPVAKEPVIEEVVDEGVTDEHYVGAPAAPEFVDDELDAASDLAEIEEEPPISLRLEDFTTALASADVAAEADMDEPDIVRAADELDLREPDVVKLPDEPPCEHDLPVAALADEILAHLPEQRPAVLLFAGAGEEAGSTGLVARLAAVLARRFPGEVLAVDADGAQPELAAAFRVEPRQTLADVLAGRVDWREAAEPTQVAGLSVLSGQAGASRMGRPLGPLLAVLRREARFILLDAPSVTDAEVTPLARLCDATYVVVRLGQTPQRAALDAVEALQYAGGRVLGCVLTGAGEEPIREPPQPARTAGTYRSGNQFSDRL